MKNLSRLLFAMLLVLVCSNVNAQDENNPWKITVGVNAVDFYPVGEPAPQGPLFDEYYNVTDHWNILPSLSVIGVSKYINKGISVGVIGSLNRIDHVGDESANNEAYYGIDGLVKYNFLQNTTLDPFAGLGGGYTWVNQIGAGTANATVGANVWFSEHVGLTLQVSYKYSFEEYLMTHFQHTAGISIRFGGTDTDGDGIYDKDDACPHVPGLKEFAGCPDTDLDGIQDSQDECPDDAGLAEYNGCPDTDGDGVPDNKDECPTVAGLKALNGCPDTDGDGVADENDKCPDVAGPAANSGCPWPDTDGDGVIDKDDKCPDTPGTVANDGCPELSEAVQKSLNAYAKTILFDTGKASIKEHSAEVLANIIAILNEYPNAKFTIEGYTDSVGSEKLNLELSDARAISVKDYLVKNGIDEFRLSANGYGEANPIDTNKTRAGRANNRRVEINLVKDK